MLCKSRRMGVAVVLLSLSLSMTGCLGMDRNEPPLLDPMRSSYRMQQRLPSNPGFAGVPASRGEIQQAAHQTPLARFGGVVPAQAQENGDKPAIGEPAPIEMPAIAPPPLPTELNKTTMPPHRVAPPDSLYIEALRMIPRGPYRLEPLEVLGIEVIDIFKKQAIAGNFTISPEGTINLGQNFGSVRVGGLTVDQAQQAIRTHLGDILKTPTVSVVLVQMRGLQIVRGEHLVRPDGTVHLGMYGSVYVAGMTLGQVKSVIETHLSHYLVNPQVSVDIFAYNSRKIYIVADGAGYGQQVIALPSTGNETVLDAISRVQGLPSVSSQRKIWVARPAPAGNPVTQILPVDWKAIVQGARTETNWQLMPGDRIYIAGDPCITVYNYLDKMLSPIDRVLNTLLIGTTTYRSITGTGTGNGGLLIAP